LQAAVMTRSAACAGLDKTIRAIAHAAAVPWRKASNMPVPLRTLTQGTVARRPVHGQQVKLRLVIDAGQG
jgi:hypothetical protein